jgi:transcriptional regulator with XRE-family HTH domain
MAARVGVTPKTQRRLEQGDTSVGLAMLVRTLSVLGLAKDLDQIAARDEIGQRLSDIALPERPRRSGGKRSS